MSYYEINGDLIQLARQGEFDVIGHGCNCFCTMGAGIAVAMKNTFGCDKYNFESIEYKGAYNKLGVIEGKKFNVSTKSILPENYSGTCTQELKYPLTVLNCYTQFHYGKNHIDGIQNPLNYTALKMCLDKINYYYKGLRIGLPKIGCGLAGGEWSIVKELIKECLCDCDVIIVNYKL